MITNLRDALARGAVTVTFIKVNGEMRVMRCTTNDDLFDYEFKNVEQVYNSDILRVWDFGSNAFRSFHRENVISWEVDVKMAVDRDGNISFRM